jgi:predicted naringenin-chalcone synthase
MTTADARMRRAAGHAHESVRARVGTRSRRAVPRIAGLAVADAGPSRTQAEVLDALGLAGDEFAEGIFARCGVERRHVMIGEEFLDLNLQGRTERVEDDLFRRALGAVDALGCDPRSVGTVFSSSLYSLGCPSLAHRLVEHYGMDPATDKYHVTGVGCASAVPLVKLAAGSLQEPEDRVLVVAAESMSGTLTRAGAQDSKAKTVGSAIFGDGCAAMLLSNDPAAAGPAVLATRVHQIPGTLGAVVLSADAADSYLQLARDLPDLAAAGLDRLATDFLGANGLSRGEIDHWMVHPGGRRIVENARDALRLSDEDLDSSWQALAGHGNVGTPSVFYVLAETIEQRSPEPGEHGLIVTIGPGVTVGLMLLAW